MFDLTLLGPAGEVIVEIEAFAMRLVRDPLRTIDADRGTSPPPLSADDSESVSQHGGILPADGARAFTRILSSNIPNRVLVLPDRLRALRNPSSVASNSRTRSASSTGDLESQLVEWWQELLGIEAVSLDDDFLDLGGHSLVVARLFAKVKTAYGVDLGLSKLFEARTVRKLSRLIRDAQSNRRPDLHASPAIVAIQPDGTKPRLFVISGLGGNVIKFHSLASRLGRDYPMYGLLPRGLDGREPFHTRVEDMAEYYVNAIIGLQPTGPYCVVGYSFGGAVAFEVARQLVARNGDIGLLGMFDTIEWRYMERVGKSLGVRGRFAVLKAQLDGGDFHEHPTRVIGKRLRAKLTKSVSRVMSSLGRRVPVKSDNIEEINAIAGANYRPKVFPGRLTLFRSVNRGPLDGDDEYLGWGGLAAEGIEVHHVPSTHFTILQEPAVTSLAEKLRECLNRVPPAESGRD